MERKKKTKSNNIAPFKLQPPTKKRRTVSASNVITVNEEETNEATPILFENELQWEWDNDEHEFLETIQTVRLVQWLDENAVKQEHVFIERNLKRGKKK